MVLVDVYGDVGIYELVIRFAERHSVTLLEVGGAQSRGLADLHANRAREHLAAASPLLLCVGLRTGVRWLVLLAAVLCRYPRAAYVGDKIRQSNYLYGSAGWLRQGYFPLPSRTQSAGQAYTIYRTIYSQIHTLAGRFYTFLIIMGAHSPHHHRIICAPLYTYAYEYVHMYGDEHLGQRASQDIST